MRRGRLGGHGAAPLVRSTAVLLVGRERVPLRRMVPVAVAMFRWHVVDAVVAVTRSVVQAVEGTGTAMWVWRSGGRGQRGAGGDEQDGADERGQEPPRPHLPRPHHTVNPSLVGSTSC